ncbi:Cytochrome c oxidase assembly protein COX18, mitochondrial [Frankliniella fusca]|uniref:Cytochrome c oxidase assembly protein COX18, mitochondrial n=1 Tax=Frankliniella fusca TaxID=407009 RepID=A0AAE1I2Y1_9NEOP|nr:Cytochrome c oxidase assembly protein COX18, mitochondrial [Frankliniella fusca]
MKCHISRGLSHLRHVSGGAIYGRSGSLVDRRVEFVGAEAADGRLYHSEGCRPCPWHLRPGLGLLSAPALASQRALALRPPHTRSIIISKIIDTFRNAEITSVEGFSKFIIESAPVGAVRHFYELLEATTGLPWAANIVLCSAILQIILNGPANIYMVRWATNKEKQVADLIAVRATVMRSPSKENINMLAKTNVELTRQYGCQTYKLFLTIAYQMVHLTITSFGVRSVFMQSNPDILSSVAPWGSQLAYADPLFVLPLVNFLLSIVLVEVATWKKTQSEVGLKMTHRRANLPFKGDPLFLINLRRGVNIPVLLIYGIVPTALNIHWCVMMLSSINIQILLTHKRTRRALGIPPAYFETDKPYRDFLRHLRNDVRIFK